MVSPSAQDFAALARSSPWLWSTLRFTARWTGDPWRTGELRAWLRRPDRLRVETMEHTLVQVVHEEPQQLVVLTSEGESSTTTQPWWTSVEAPLPRLRPDGLVADRRDRFDPATSYDAPMYRDYFWVAMLDPVELADGFTDGTQTMVPGTEIDSVTELDHAGRPAWEAILRPTAGYEPRCSCCSLLRSRKVDLAEAEAGAGDKVVLAEYPTAYRVRLDVGTGVCVFTEPIGGSTRVGHRLRIEAVDEPMADGLFVAPQQPEPRLGWAPGPGLAPRS
ncbi:hypothetical protein [Microlunatus sp. Gsoil 973]|uniref:hypothetical protein n=1 Tax=Microlunatus sp. Gsoil 973 TaxID=2672569 RepID=UPI0018A7F2B9|nr:hypothetical protein [Microlunatus sp. Gsoil 973]